MLLNIILPSIFVFFCFVYFDFFTSKRDKNMNSTFIHSSISTFPFTTNSTIPQKPSTSKIPRKEYHVIKLFNQLFFYLCL